MADAKEPLVSLFFKDPEDGGNVRPESVIRPVHRHRIDKYLDTLLANQPILDVEATGKMADCPVNCSPILPNQSQRSSFAVIGYAEAGRRRKSPMTSLTCHLL